MTIALVSCGIGAAGIQAGNSVNSQDLAGIGLLAGFGTVCLAIAGYIVFLRFFRARGKTPGKAIVGIRAADKRSGGLPGIARMLLRETLGKFVSGLLFGLGYFWAIFDRDSQAWQDKIAGTIVLKSRAVQQFTSAAASGSSGP
jgi:uncharacterized RDD family membrane protein YckC